MGIKRFLKQTAVGRWALIPYRYWYASRYFAKPWLKVFPWLFQSKELANYTYELTEKSKSSLAFFVSAVSGIAPETARGFIRELENNAELESHVRLQTENSADRNASDSDGKPGKRYLYYALIRALKPATVFEAGTEKGYGSCVMAAALNRNKQEGRPGLLHCIDMNPIAGFLFVSPFSNGMVKEFGDSVQAIRDFNGEIDLLIHDTTTLEEHERAQFEAAESKLSERGMICSAWVTLELMHFAERTGRQCLTFRDEPKDHWYPGGSLTVVFYPPRR